MSTDTTLSRHALMSIVVARSQELCVAYVSGCDLVPDIESLFGALSRLQQFDDKHADDGPSTEQGRAGG